MIFFGIKFNNTISLLVTHFDNKNYDEELKWLTSFEQNPIMKNLNKTVLGGRIFFTGAYIDNVEPDTLNNFIILQDDRKRRFLNKLIEIRPVSFKYNGSGDVLPLDIYESAKLTSLNLRILPHQTEKLKDELLNLRLQFAKLLKIKNFEGVEDLQERIDDIMKRTERIAKDDLALAKPDDDQLKNIIIYDKMEVELKKLSAKVQSQHDLFMSRTEEFKREALLTKTLPNLKDEDEKDDDIEKASLDEFGGL